MKWMKVLAGIGIAAAAIGGLVWASDLNGSSGRAQASAPTVDVESLIAQKTGLSVASVQKVEAAALSVAADKAEAKGLITPSQADKLRNLNVGPILNSVMDSAAKAAGVGDQALIDGLSSGQSLAQIAAAQGISRDQLKANLTAALQAQLATQQNAGLLDSSQSGMIMTAFNSYLDKIIDFTLGTHK